MRDAELNQDRWAQSQNQYQYVPDVGHETLIIMSSGPLTNSSGWLDSSHEVLMSSVNVEESVETAFHLKEKYLNQC